MIVRVMQPRFPTTVLLGTLAVDAGAVGADDAAGALGVLGEVGGVEGRGAVGAGADGVDRVVTVWAGVEGLDGGGVDGLGVGFRAEGFEVGDECFTGLEDEAAGCEVFLGFGFAELPLGAGDAVALGRVAEAVADVGVGVADALAGVTVDDVGSFGGSGRT